MLDYKVISPEGVCEKDFYNCSVLPVFDEIVLEFIQTISSRLLSDRKYREYPELIAMAFWMRKSNLIRLKKIFEERHSNHGNLIKARGLVFHIAPSNVNTIFLYSLVSSPPQITLIPHNLEK